MVAANESAYHHPQWTSSSSEAAAARPARLSQELDRPQGAGQGRRTASTGGLTRSGVATEGRVTPRRNGITSSTAATLRAPTVTTVMTRRRSTTTISRHSQTGPVTTASSSPGGRVHRLRTTRRAMRTERSVAHRGSPSRRVRSTRTAHSIGTTISALCDVRTGAAFVLSIGLTACAGGGSTSAPPTSQPGSAQATTPSQGLARCTPSQLVLERRGVTVQSGVVIIGIQLHNVSRVACNATGYPKVRLLARDGSVLRFRVLHGGTEYGDQNADPIVDLQPNYEANFNLQWDRQPAGHCAYVKRARLAGTKARIAVASGGRSVKVCGLALHEAAVYNPPYPAGS